MNAPRLRVAFAACLISTGALAAQVPSPKEFLGHDIGEDYFLASYTQLRSYWNELAARSDRVRIERFGTTSYGQPMVLAVVSSPRNLARLDELRATSARLARGRDVDEDFVRGACESGRAVVWIDAGMHATESVAAQNIIELVYRMASRDDPEVHRVLDEVVLLVCPANPDGMELIANAYMATRRVGGIPVLYQRYVGHDNNRDYYLCSQAETRAISRMHYHRWHPQIVYNHHQSAPRGTVIFTPPFRDPFNYNVDPIVVRGIELVSAHMNRRFAVEGKPGVISRSGASYSTWWNGGLRTTVYFHNMIGILTESFGSPDPSKIEQRLDRRLPYSDYPDPIGSQDWHARQLIEYLQTANFAILDLASRYRRELLHDRWVMARRSIERGSRDHWTPTPRLVAIQKDREEKARESDGGAEVVEAFTDPALRDPRAYVLPADAVDFPAATRLVRALRRSGVEVRRAVEPIDVPGRPQAPAGSYVVRADQAFRPHVLDMFEPQWHPDDIGSSGEPVRPYDVAGWTLAMQMGVSVVRLFDPAEMALAPIDAIEVPFHPGAVSDGDAGYLFTRRNSNSYLAANRLLAAGEKVVTLEESFESAGSGWAPGTFLVHKGARTEVRVRALAAELGVDFFGAAGDRSAPHPRARPLRLARIGLFDVWGGDMATGWTQWVLEQFEFPAEPVFGARVEAGDLIDDFDVLVFHTGLPATGARDRRDTALRRGRNRTVKPEDIPKLEEALPPFEDWSSIEDRRVRLTVEKSIPALREFVGSGGRILAFGQQAERIIDHFDLPVEVGTFVTEEDGERRATRRSEFFIPGSLLWGDVEVDDPLAWGSDARPAIMFRRSPVFAPVAEAENADSVDVVARYVDEEAILASGWTLGADLVRGKAAALRVAVGEGDVCLYGADVLFRAQPLATFRLVFNALYR